MSISAKIAFNFRIAYWKLFVFQVTSTRTSLRNCNFKRKVFFSVEGKVTIEKSSVSFHYREYDRHHTPAAQCSVSLSSPTHTPCEDMFSLNLNISS